jgi:AAA family ATP:ADP antiporter
VVAYEFTATLTDFGISVVFERSFHDEILLTKMYGRLGWIVSATALVGQIFLVPILLPHKRIALLVPPLVMLAGAVSVLVLPVVATAMLLAASDRGLNYSIQQATKESLYVPLSDVQKYKSKAFIDMFVDRAAKALAAFALIAIIRAVGASVTVSLVVAIASMALWALAAYALGAFWGKKGFVRRRDRPGKKKENVLLARA